MPALPSNSLTFSFRGHWTESRTHYLSITRDDRAPSASLWLWAKLARDTELLSAAKALRTEGQAPTNGDASVSDFRVSVRQDREVLKGDALSEPGLHWSGSRDGAGQKSEALSFAQTTALQSVSEIILGKREQV